MGYYKWRPSKSQRREFAERMNNDADFAQQYEQRKAEKAEKRRATSEFDYETAGGCYYVTKEQYTAAANLQFDSNLTEREKDACNQVMYAFDCNEKTHHDNIHIINELRREIENY